MGQQTSMWRQADVLLIAVDSVPSGARPAPDAVVAHGEMTGHRHRFETAARRFLTPGGWQYVEVHEDFADLVHEEHGTIRLPREVYRVKIQREYSPLELRPVLD